MRPVVEVAHLRDFQRSVREIDREAARGLRVALNKCATFLVDRARPKIPARSGAARASLKPRSSQTSVRIAVGGRRARHYPWLDFGGRTGRNKSVVRPFLSSGRYLYPTLTESRAEFIRIMDAALAGVAESVGLDVD